MPDDGVLLIGRGAPEAGDVEVRGKWYDGVIDVVQARLSVGDEKRIFHSELGALRSSLEQSLPTQVDPATKIVSAPLLEELQSHPDVVRVTGVTVTSGRTVLVVAAHPEAQVRALVSGSVREGQVHVVTSPWSRSELDHVGRALGSLEPGEMIRAGQAVNKFGVPFWFAHTRLPVEIGNVIPPGLLRVTSWIQPV